MHSKSAGKKWGEKAEVQREKGSNAEARDCNRGAQQQQRRTAAVEVRSRSRGAPQWQRCAAAAEAHRSSRGALNVWEGLDWDWERCISEKMVHAKEAKRQTNESVLEKS